MNLYGRKTVLNTEIFHIQSPKHIQVESAAKSLKYLFKKTVSLSH